MLAILAFLVVLLVLVLIHEAGHALMARASGCRVEEFGFGIPPRLAGTRIGETVFSLNALPIGGFVRLTGEEEAETHDPRAFVSKSYLWRALILAAGILANLALAVVVFTAAAGLGIDVPADAADGRVQKRRVEILEVRNTPTLRDAGIRPNDVIVAVGGTPATDAGDVAQRVRSFAGAELALTVRRNGTDVPLTLRFSPPKKAEEVVGLTLLDVGTIRVPWSQAPAEGLRMTGRTIAATWNGLTRMIRDFVVTRKAPEDIAGPVGIAIITGTVAQRGLPSLLELIGVLSVNLALVNALPIPALDGGRLLFLLLDALGLRALRGRPERYAHAVGFVLLLVLLALITAQDLQRLTH